MRRLGLVVSSAAVFVLCVAAPALAGSGSEIPGPGGSVHGAGGVRGAGGTAFTGARGISVGLLLIGVLLVAGIVSLVASRRRTATN